MRKFLTSISLELNELRNALLQVLGSDPTSDNGAAGRIWYNSTAGRAKIQTGAGIKHLLMEGDGAGGDADTLDGQDGLYYLARANHTGSQAAATISDFDTQVRTSRLDQMAAPTSALSLNSQRITSLATPTSDNDAATKQYVDAISQGLDVKSSVRAATTANITLSNEQTIDGVALVAGDRVLVKDQSTGSQNGIYVVVNGGAWTRSADAADAGELTGGTFVFVEEGTSNADSGWVIATDGAITIGTTAIAWVQFSGAGQITAGDGLTKSGNTLNVGAGTGISVAADAVAIDTAVVARKFAADVGDNSAVAFVITHNLGTRDVVVSVYLNSGDFEEVEVDVEKTSTNTITLRFAVAPATNAYRVAVIG